MNTHTQLQDAIRALSEAFAPFDCRIQATRRGNFSFTVVDRSGIAQYTQRLYPGQYSGESLKRVIERTRATLSA